MEHASTQQRTKVEFTPQAPTAKRPHGSVYVLLTSVRTDWPGGQLLALAKGVAREFRQKFSGGHGSQVPLVSLPKVPGAHATSHEVEFAALKVLQSHRVHGAASEVALNLPAGQGVHSPSRAQVPAAQLLRPASPWQSLVSPGLGSKNSFRSSQSPEWSVQCASQPVEYFP